MALLNNTSQLSMMPAQFTSASGLPQAAWPNWFKPGHTRNWWYGDATVVGVTDRAAVPNGHLSPSAWLLPPKSGGLSTYTQIDGVGDLAANLAGGLAAAAAMSGTGSLLADLAGLGALLATLPGSGTLTGDADAVGALAASIAGAGDLDGELLAVLNAVATLAGTGDLDGGLAGAASIGALISGAGSLDANLAGGALLAAVLAGAGAVDGDLTAVWSMSATLSGSGSVAAAALTALGNAVATLNGVGSVAATPSGLGFMEAFITACADTGDCPSAGQIADAVWESVVSNYNATGTFGFALGFIYHSLHNKVITDPVAGTYDVYGDDDATVIFTGSLWEDADGTQPYRGDGAERRDRLNP